MSDQATSGQVSTDTANADANVTEGSTSVTQAAGDTITGGADTVAGAGGNDTLPGNTDTVAGANGDDTVTGADDTVKGGEDTVNGGDDDTIEGAPETYEDFIAPEGVELDTELLGEFTGIAKELKLTQADAQKIVDLGPKVMQKFADMQAKVVLDAQVKWSNDSKADTEFGGENLDKNLALSKAALDQFGTQELKTLLVESGLGNHPEVIRVFYRIGKGISNDGLVSGRQGTTGEKSLADKLYSNTTSSK